MSTNFLPACALSLLLISSNALADDPHFKDLGPQITSTLLQGSTFAKDANGAPLLCTVIRGQPAKLLVFDVASGKLLKRLSLEGANGAWNACTATDGSVYVSTDDNGHLYRWIPGEESASDLGLVAPNQTFAWDVRPGVDGEVFVATYPGCLILRYHPKDGFSDLGKGAVAPGENYARSVTYDAATEKIYVGVGSHAHLIELDRKTGDKKNILPTEFASHEFCYTVNFVGGKLFALPTNPPQAIVMNPATLEIEAKLTGVQPQMVMSPLSPDGGKVYFNADGKLASYDFKTRSQETIAPDQTMSILAMTWLADGKLAIAARGAKIVTYDPKSGEMKSVALDVPPEPTPIHSICLGPDGRIYTGGYLSGGLGAYDPATDKDEQYRGLSQAEGITVLGDRLYFGIYPHARLTWFDTTQPWDGKNNPHEFDHLDRVEQDRPIGIVAVPSRKQVFYGTVPDYGKLGGVVAVVDQANDNVEIHRNVIADQSIVSLTYADGLIVGGTAIAGGLGIDPKAKEAEIFLWDPDKKAVAFETVPVPGSTLTSGLVVGPDKNIWGIGDGTLFVFDLANRKVVYTKKLFDVDVKARHAGWRDAMLILHPSGQIYGTMGNKLFRLDPSTKDVTVLRDHEAALLGMDRDGHIYFRDTTHLWKYTP